MYKNKPGMQGTELIQGNELEEVQWAWRDAARSASAHAEEIFSLGLHKQHAGRIVEPYTYTFVCMTTTEIENFLWLRDDSDAQPEIQDLAVAIRAALDTSTPQLLEYGQWHLPYLREEDMRLHINDKLKISAARCARVSYKNFEGKITTQEEDLALFKKLVTGKPHLSPTEHQACASNYSDYNYRNLRGNYTGYKQYRKFIEAELKGF
jgi:thymidylate synthase ThyX